MENAGTRETSASGPDAAGNVKSVTEGAGFHCANPQAAVSWNPANTAAAVLNGTPEEPLINIAGND